jgi:hypothetical protein
MIGETESSSAATRNYGRQEPAFASPPRSAPLTPGIGDVIAGDTARTYAAPAWTPSSPPVTAPIRSKFHSPLWILLLVLALLFVVSGAFFAGRNAERRSAGISREFSPEEEARQRHEQQRQALQDLISQAQEQAREALDHQREALDHAREAAERASEAAAALAPGGEKPLDLSTYEYPGAILSNSIRVPNHEMLAQRTPDEFDKINQFYQKKLGKPIIEINESWEKRLLFQSSDSPAVTVSVETDYEHGGQLKITVLRSPFIPLMPGEPPAGGKR